MKFEVNKPVFLDALQMACNAIPSKTTLQILYNLLLQLKGNELEIRATDLDMTIVLKLAVEGHEDGSIVVNARKLLEVVKELPDFPVLVSVATTVTLSPYSTMSPISALKLGTEATISGDPTTIYEVAGILRPKTVC